MIDINIPEATSLPSEIDQDKCINLYIEILKGTTGFKIIVERLTASLILNIGNSIFNKKKTAKIAFYLNYDQNLISYYNAAYYSDCPIPYKAVRKKIIEAVLETVGRSFLNKGYRTKLKDLSEDDGTIIIYW